MQFSSIAFTTTVSTLVVHSSTIMMFLPRSFAFRSVHPVVGRNPLFFGNTSYSNKMGSSSSSSSVLSSSSSVLFSTTSSTTKANENVDVVVSDAEAVPDAYEKVSMDEIVSLCKRRGFIFPSSEIYNGMAGFYDYGPLG